MCILEALYISDKNVSDKKEIKVNLTLNKDRDASQKWKSPDYKMKNKKHNWQRFAQEVEEKLKDLSANFKPH